MNSFAEPENEPTGVAEPAAPPAVPATKPTHRGRWLLAALIVLVVAAAFRFANLNWDEGTHLHPDERFLTMVETNIRPVKSLAEYFDTGRSTLNPHNQGFGFYVYGTLPIFLVRYTAEGLIYGEDKLTEMAQNDTADSSKPPDKPHTKTPFNDYQHVVIVGRAVSASFDLLTVALVFLIGAKMFNRGVGLLASALAAISVLPIQLSHFFAVDTFANFFILLAILFTVHMATTKHPGRLVLLALGFGLATGMALASKLTAIPLVLLLPTALFIRGSGWHGYTSAGSHVFQDTGKKTFPCHPRQFIFPVSIVLLATLICFLAFRVFQPYAFAGPGFWDLNLNPKWVANITELNNQVSNPFSMPCSLQWVDRPVWFSGVNMVLWGLGLPLGLAAWAGFLLAGWRIFKGQWRNLLLLWGWVAVFFTWQSLGPNPTMRYQMPVYPILAIFAAWLVFELAGTYRRKVLAGVVGTAVLAGAFAWAFAFAHVHAHTVTRIEASRWIFENVKPGSVLANETPWDDGLPMRIDHKDPFGGMYKGLTLELYWPDNESKRDRLLAMLNQADVLLITSNRQWGSLTRLPWKFPLTTAYYRHLLGCPPDRDAIDCFRVARTGMFQGDLGFDLVHVSQSDPSIGPWQINDQCAEEAFTVYDHPKVLIFKKRADYDPNRVRTILSSVDLSNVRDHQNDLMLPENRRQIQQAGGTWSELFNRNSPINRYPALGAIVWYLALLALGVLAFPLVRWLLPGLGDDAWAFGRTAGLLFVAYSVWLAGSFNLPVTRLTIGATILVLAGLSILVWFFNPPIRKIPRRSFLTIEIIFLLLFVADLLVRWANPDLWHPFLGGEKPMDFAYFNAVLKSTSFPPYDPWFAGGYINYYYFGFVFVGMFVKFLGLVPAVAYNLVVPTLFALMGVSGFALARSLTNPERPGRRFLAGIMGTLSLVILGNLGTVQMALIGLNNWKWQPAVGVFSQLKQTIVKGLDKWHYRSDWYWIPSRIIPVPPGEVVQPITEFPVFTVLYGDLHAHLMALPITLLALAWVASLFKSRDQISLGRLAAVIPAGALAIGALRVTNTWDLPLYLGLGLIAILYAVRPVRRMIFAFGLLIALTFVLYYPFDLWYGAAYNSVKWWTKSRTPWFAYLWHWGWFLFILASWLAWEVYAYIRSRSYRPDAKRLVFILVAAGLALITMVEIIVVAGDIERMNTVFKFYLQAWTLMAVASGAAIGWLWPRRWIWWVGLALLTIAAGLYPAVAGYCKILDRMAPAAPRTLDGMRYMADARHFEQNTHMSLAEDYRAIQWMQNNVKGSPVIVEANMPQYHWGSRFSIYTGLPAVVGWGWHQEQQRTFAGRDRVNQRINDVHEFYRTADLQKTNDFLQRYHVEYIILGQLERACYPGPGLEKFKQFKAVYQDGQTVIYQVE